jgi:hypothetical protein|tara:strand:- start:1523 stop:1750 length:228 start_codon:yes stop_codon:yes gene_type:complete
MGWKISNTGELWDGGTHQLGGETWTGSTRTSESKRLEWTNEVPKKPAKKKRARDNKGRLKADDPSTPDVNEAWEQ